MSLMGNPLSLKKMSGLKGIVQTDRFQQVRDDAQWEDAAEREQGDGDGGGGYGGSLGIDTVAELLVAQQKYSSTIPVLDMFEAPGEQPPGPFGAHGDGGPRTAALRDAAPAWWNMRPKWTAAADAFDGRFKTRTARAERLLSSLIADVKHTQPSPRKVEAFHEAVFELSATVFVAPPPTPPTEAVRVKKKRAAPPPKQVEAWCLEKSIWKGRPAWADSKSFYDTDAVEHLKLNLEWARALGCGMEKFILKNDDDGAEDEDGDGVADEIEDVHKVLWENRRIFSMCFDHYASIGGDSIDNISLNEWNAFVDDCNLANQKSKFCKRADLDRLFIAVDGVSSAASGSRRRDNSLGRGEFLQCIVRLCVLKYVQPKTIADVSEALEVLCKKDILPNMHELDEPPNEFRRRCCYRVETDSVLRQHESSVRELFEAVGRLSRKPSLKSLGVLLSLSDWKTLTRRLELIDADLTERDATLCFVNSRMAVIDGTSDRGKLKEASLPWEGFLECLCRVAVLKALPTDDELASSGHEHAGAFLRELREGDRVKYKFFIDTHATAYGNEPRQPLWRCVHHLLTYILRNIEVAVESDKGGKGFAADLTISRQEMRQWVGLWRERREEQMNTNTE